MNSTGVSNTSIDTFTNLGITTTFHTVIRHKTTTSEEYAETVNSALAEYSDKAMILNIDDYHSIHTKRIPNTTTTFIVIHLAIILINLIAIQNAISKTNIHNPILVDAELIKTNVENKFIMLYGYSYNQQ